MRSLMKSSVRPLGQVMWSWTITLRLVPSIPIRPMWGLSPQSDQYRYLRGTKYRLNALLSCLEALGALQNYKASEKSLSLSLRREIERNRKEVRAKHKHKKFKKLKKNRSISLLNHWSKPTLQCWRETARTQVKDQRRYWLNYLYN